MTSNIRTWRMTIGAIPPAEIRGNSKTPPRFRGRTKNLWKASGRDHAWADAPGIRITFPVRITFTFHHNRKIDLDNLAIGMKPWVDGLVLAGMLVDDDPNHVVYGEHGFQFCAKGESKTEALIEEVSPGPKS